MLKDFYYFNLKIFFYSILSKVVNSNISNFKLVMINIKHKSGKN